jgi:hypothetical protein
VTIIEDQNRLRQENVKFLKDFLTEHFETVYDKLNEKYVALIEKNVLDPTDRDDVLLFLKKKYNTILSTDLPNTDSSVVLLSGIKMKGAQYEYSASKLLDYSTSIIQRIYPTLPASLESGDMPLDFQWFKINLMTTSELLFIKHLVSSFGSRTNYDEHIFKDYQSQLFFEYLLENWLNEIERPKSAISYILRELRYKDNPDGKYNIICDSLREFAEYWNENVNHLHGYRIKFKDKTPSLKSPDEISKRELYHIKFTRLKESFERVGIKNP